MGISERKQREKEERKRVILDAAEKLFFAHSYDAVSMDEIARATELSKPTIYLHFQDKESLFMSIVERGYRIQYGMMQAAAKDADSGMDQLAAIGISYHRFVTTHPDYHRVLNYFRSGRFDVLEDTGNETLEAVYRALQDIFELNYAAIETGIRDGTLRSEIDPFILSILLSIFSISAHNIIPRMRKQLEARGIDSERFSEEFINMMYNMVENPKHRVSRRTHGKKTGKTS